MNVLILGGGPAGMASALALARASHAVTVLERDPVDPHTLDDAFDRARHGIAHFRQPHAFTPRTRMEMRRNAPDVQQRLLDAGAEDIDLRRMLPGTPMPGDEDLQYTAVRRPVIEWALLAALAQEPSVTIRSPVKVVGLLGSKDHVTGARTDAGDVPAELVVDALGRTSRSPDWLEQLGAPPAAEQRSDASVIYYSRYFRVRDGVTLPEAPGIPTPRGDLGYAGFSTFPGDNRTFAGVFAISPHDRDLKVLHDVRAFMAAAARVPPLWSWINPDVAEPITEVLAMGGIDNRMRWAGDVPGLVPVGDSWCHTDPVFALGLSFSLSQAFALARAVSTRGDDLRDVASAYRAACEPEVAERYPWVTSFDNARTRAWAGETSPADAGTRGSPLFGVAAAGAAATQDPDIFRVFVRRNTFLDPLSVLDEDVAMQERIEKIFADIVSRPRSPLPSREELLEAAARAIA